MVERPPNAELARIYDRLYSQSPFEDMPEFYRWVIALARPAPGEALLDIGCGRGGALHAAHALNARGFGLDLSRVALRETRRRIPGARVVQADGARLPFADGAFRHLLNLGNLEHFADLEGGIREMRRVLAADGKAWILLPNLFYSGAIWRVIRTGRGPDHHQPIDRFATRAEWQELLAAGGLRVLRTYPYHRGKWWKRILPANLAWHFLFETARGEIDGRVPLRALERVQVNRPEFAVPKNQIDDRQS